MLNVKRMGFMPAITCSKSITEAVEQGAKYVQS